MNVSGGRVDEGTWGITTQDFHQTLLCKSLISSAGLWPGGGNTGKLPTFYKALWMCWSTSTNTWGFLRFDSFLRGKTIKHWVLCWEVGQHIRQKQFLRMVALWSPGCGKPWGEASFASLPSAMQSVTGWVVVQIQQQVLTTQQWHVAAWCDKATSSPGPWLGFVIVFGFLRNMALPLVGNVSVPPKPTLPALQQASFPLHHMPDVYLTACHSAEHSSEVKTTY